MRPFSLELEGFTSFRQRAVIDFTGLDIFAITGPTGAGKTSIIDAITYCLYGCTPRLGKQSISELINQGADRAKAMFEFASGDCRYRVARQTKWTGKKAGSDVRFEKLEGDKWISLADKISQADALIESVVGLDFSGFTKSVVLPQGRFDEFLKGKVDERRRILSDLLQLDIYSRMMQRANEIAREGKNKADTLDGLLARDYGASTPERLALLRGELVDLKPSLEPLTMELNRVRELLQTAHNLRQNRRELITVEADLKRMGPDRTEAEKRIATAKKAINERQKKIDELDAQIKSSSYDSRLRDELVAKLQKSQRLHEQEKRIRSIEEARTGRTRRTSDLETNYKNAEAALETASKKRDLVKKQHDSDKKSLDAAVRKYGSADAIRAVIEANRRRLREEERKKKLEDELTRLNEDVKRRETTLKEAGDDEAKRRASLDRARDELDHLQRKYSAEELKLLLERGQPCPVCEQPVERVPKSRAHPSIELAKKAIGKQENELNRLIRSKSTIEGELSQLAPRVTGKGDEIRSAQAALDDAEKAVRDVLKKRPGKDAEGELEKLRDQALRLRTAVEEAVLRLDELRDEESKARERAEKIRQELIKLETETAAESQELQRIAAEIKELRAGLGEYSDVAAVKAALKQQDDAKTKLEGALHSKEIEAEAMSNAKDALAGDSSTLERLKAQGEASELSRAKLIKAAKSSMSLLLSAFPDLRVEIERADDDAAAQLEQKARELECERDEIKRTVLQREKEIETLEAQIKRAAELREEIERARANAAIAHDLAQALRGDQFIAFIQQEAYHRLAVDGSRHLMTLSSGRYSFGFEKDEFIVLDHWNADDARPVTTLSGGESFLASLALALALAEGLSGLSHRRGGFALESLFLDEGFGTLDAETLDVVLQGVENLSTTNRLVGIVSHIPELAERMPVRINVRKSVGGSTIEIS